MMRSLYILAVLSLLGGAGVGWADSDSVPSKGTFYVSLLDPYPATVGIGITHFVSENWAFSAGIGRGDSTVFALGLDFRPISRRLSPLFGLHLSTGNDGTVPEKEFLYVSTGLDWKWDSGLFVHPGVNWGITPRGGQTQITPYLEFGAAY